MKKDKYIEYYPNGMKWREVTLKDGKEDGLWTQWYENGQKEEGICKDGVLVTSKCWDEDGNEMNCE